MKPIAKVSTSNNSPYPKPLIKFKVKIANPEYKAPYSNCLINPIPPTKPILTINIKIFF